MTLPKELITITPLSRYFSLFILIALPFIGFYVGFRYAERFTEYIESRSSVDQYILTNQPTATQSASTASPAPNGDRANWKTYRNTKYSYSLRYPPTWSLEENYNESKQVIFNEQIWMVVGSIDYEGCIAECPKIDSTKNLIVNGIRMKRIEGNTFNSAHNTIVKYIHYIVEGKNPLTFIYYGDPEKRLPDQTILFDQILSTFQFTDQ